MQIEQTQKSGDVIDAAVQDANRGHPSRSPGAAEAVFVCSPRGAHTKRCPQGGQRRSRTYNRNLMTPAPIYGLQEL